MKTLIVGIGLAMKKAAIEKAAGARGDKIVRWFSDKLSGATMDRPGLEKLRGEARAGELARLYVYRLDRLTRSGIRDTLAVVEELRGHGCTIAPSLTASTWLGPPARPCSRSSAGRRRCSAWLSASGSPQPAPA